MFSVKVEYVNHVSDELLREVKECYANIRNYGELCSNYPDWCELDEAMVAWAVELGWDIGSVVEEIAEALATDFYSDEDPRHNFYYEIVNDAIACIDEHLLLATKSEG